MQRMQYAAHATYLHTMLVYLTQYVLCTHHVVQDGSNAHHDATGDDVTPSLCALV